MMKNVWRNGDGKVCASNSPPRTPTKVKARKLPAISARNVQERITHLLAIRPLKKLELYTRLKNEGLKESHRLAIPKVLKSIAKFQNNTFNLRCYVWREVNVEWPYFTEEERRQVRLQMPSKNAMLPPTPDSVESDSTAISPMSQYSAESPIDIPAVADAGIGGEQSANRTTYKRLREVEEEEEKEENSAHSAQKKWISHTSNQLPAAHIRLNAAKHSKNLTSAAYATTTHSNEEGLKSQNCQYNLVPWTRYAIPVAENLCNARKSHAAVNSGDAAGVRLIKDNNLSDPRIKNLIVSSDNGTTRSDLVWNQTPANKALANEQQQPKGECECQGRKKRLLIENRNEAQTPEYLFNLQFVTLYDELTAIPYGSPEFEEVVTQICKL